MPRRPRARTRATLGEQVSLKPEDIGKLDGAGRGGVRPAVRGARISGAILSMSPALRSLLRIKVIAGKGRRGRCRASPTAGLRNGSGEVGGSSLRASSRSVTTSTVLLANKSKY
jgi:hypothetical protein